jgi:hypothetical protein
MPDKHGVADQLEDDWWSNPGFSTMRGGYFHPRERCPVLDVVIGSFSSSRSMTPSRETKALTPQQLNSLRTPIERFPYARDGSAR